MSKMIILSMFFLSIGCSNRQLPSIVVFGTSSKVHVSDEWTVSFAIQINESSKDRSTLKYNQIKSELDNAIVSSNLKKDDVKGESFSIFPWYEWEKNSNVLKGFQLVQNFSLKTDNLELVEKFVSTISKIETITVSGVNQSLKDETAIAMRNDLYMDAMKDAKLKIDSIVSASDRKFKRYILISEDTDTLPHDVVGSMEASMSYKSEAKPQTMNLEFTPATIKVSTKIKVVAEID